MLVFVVQNMNKLVFTIKQHLLRITIQKNENYKKTCEMKRLNDALQEILQKNVPICHEKV